MPSVVVRHKATRLLRAEAPVPSTMGRPCGQDSLGFENEGLEGEECGWLGKSVWWEGT